MNKFYFSREEVNKAKEFGNVTENGVTFIDELESIHGCNFYLFKEKGITTKMLIEAKKLIRKDRDVVKFYIAYPEKEEE